MKQLPRKVILSEAKERAEETFEKKQSILQDAVAKISELRNVKIRTVEQLEAISHEWLEGEISKSKSNLYSLFGSAGGFIPSGISRQFSDEYERVRNDCYSPIETIVSCVAWCKEKGIGLKIDSQGRPWLNEKDVKNAVEQLATHTFSEEERAYYERFQAIFEAMDALRAYESENGFEPSNLQSVISERMIAVYIGEKTLKTEHKPYQYNPIEYLRLIHWGKIMRRKHEDAEDSEA